MTFIEWLFARWRGATPGATRQAPVAPTPRQTRRVPDQYLPLHTYLEQRYASNVVLTFDQIESLLGSALPDSARTREDWWTGEAAPQDRHAETWTAARRTATPNLMARTVAFERP